MTNSSKRIKTPFFPMRNENIDILKYLIRYVIA
jgi:hypothetical protein